jgi:hypothetical protein
MQKLDIQYLKFFKSNIKKNRENILEILNKIILDNILKTSELAPNVTINENQNQSSTNLQLSVSSQPMVTTAPNQMLKTYISMISDAMRNYDL